MISISILLRYQYQYQYENILREEQCPGAMISIHIKIVSISINININIDNILREEQCASVCEQKGPTLRRLPTYPLDHSPTSGGENCEIASLASNVKSYKKVSKMAQTHPLGHSPTCGGDNFHLTTHLWKTM